MTDENASTMGTTPRAQELTARKPLGEMSPNLSIKSTFGSALGPQKPLAGSPLKRSFTAAIGDQGFTYLKRRKGSLEHSERTQSQPLGITASKTPSVLNDESLASLPAVGDLTSIPPAAQPSPTEPNTPPSSPEGDQQSRGSSAGRHSFSSLINYDQSSQHMPASQTASRPPAIRRPSNAELLRLRLRVAMYKVETGQVGVPFTELRIEGEAELPTLEAVLPDEEAVVTSVQRRVAAKLQSSSSQHENERRMRYPGLAAHSTPYHNRRSYDDRLSSPPPFIVIPQKRSSLQTPTCARIQAQEDGELTSSTVKGRIVEGLLGLKNAV